MTQNVTFKNMENIEKEIFSRNPNDPYLVFNLVQSKTWSNVTVDITPLQENSFSYVTSGMGG